MVSNKSIFPAFVFVSLPLQLRKLTESEKLQKDTSFGRFAFICPIWLRIFICFGGRPMSTKNRSIKTNRKGKFSISSSNHFFLININWYLFIVLQGTLRYKHVFIPREMQKHPRIQKVFDSKIIILQMLYFI